MTCLCTRAVMVGAFASETMCVRFHRKARTRTKFRASHTVFFRPLLIAMAIKNTHDDHASPILG